MVKKQQLCLALDTASDNTSVALLADDGTHAVNEMTAARGQGEALMGMIQDVLKQMNKAPQDITCIAVTVGPGSFTGVRIGLAAARGFALALDIPVMGVDNFLATAYNVHKKTKVVLDSKREDYFVQDFDAKGTPLASPKIESVQELKKMLPFTACGSGAQRLKQEIGCSIMTNKTATALVIAKIALDHPKKTTQPHPLYLREADVTI